jgi:succinate-semialdehyde dehydrogenase/glutarate-semialdehyde dehydrogenase
LARSDSLLELGAQLKATLSQGATLAYRAELEVGAGFYFPPTILSDVSPEMVAAQEETFGPLAVILAVKDADVARVANHSPYGLGCSIWTRDLERGSLLASELDAGMVAINSLVVADPRLPFGGVKRSGYGREMSVEGVRELTNVKAVSFGKSDGPRFSR